MQNLNSLKFIELLPPNLRSDTDIIAISKVIDQFFTIEIEKNKQTAIYSDINNQPHEVLDVLAPDMHVDLYDKSWNLQKKREACINSQNWHDYKGTPEVLEEIARSIIGSAQVQEWHEYNGIPYHFKISFNLINETLDEYTLSQLGDIVRKYKNLRSKVDGINYRSTAKGLVRMACAALYREKITVLSIDTGPMIWDLHLWGAENEPGYTEGYWN